MKKFITITFFLLTVKCSYIYAQIPNGNFENWNSIVYTELDNWKTGNLDAIKQLGVAPVTKVTGMSGFAVRMETMLASGNLTNSYITNGDPFQGNGGIPCNQIPTSISGFYRSMIQPGDTALILCMFKKNGAIFNSNIFYITGNQNTFTSFSFPLSLGLVTPDSVILAATSSNLISGSGVANGSWLELEDLNLPVTPGPGINIPNGGFNNWTVKSNDLLLNWVSYNDIIKTTDSYSGFAAKITTVNDGSFINPGTMYTGYETPNGPVQAGFPFANMVDTLRGYFKYLATTDSASIYITLRNNGTYIGGNYMFLLPTINYAYFEIPISSGLPPDSMSIGANSSNNPPTLSSVGNSLYLDHLYLASTGSTSIFNPNNKLSGDVSVYPNPVTEASIINLSKNLYGSVKVEIYDAIGHLVFIEKFNNSGTQIPLNTTLLDPGMYYSRVTCGDFQVQAKFIKK